MEIYLVNKDDELKETYKNVTSWDANFIEYVEGVMKTKQYAGADEYFTDQKPEEKQNK